jgi:biofilm PGA synthesis N-glycosyltransferase PgaC
MATLSAQRKDGAARRICRTRRRTLVESVDRRLVVLIPARDEAAKIADAIEALWRQSRRPDQIIVVANNCTDGGATLQTARSCGAWGLDLPNCRGKKAGALNVALDIVLPDMAEDDLLLVQDADTVLNGDFLVTAEGAMRRRVGAVGAVFYGEPGGGILGQLQRMEYERYAWEIARNGGRAVVLSGTATLFRVSVLRQVKQARVSGRIGGGSGYYSLASLTEDDEMTKAVKTLGYKTMSPSGCSVVTEVMKTIPALWNQRIRWQRGALENLRDYGLTRVTAPYLARQVMMGIGALALGLYLIFLTVMISSGGHFSFSPFWTSIGLLFVFEKVETVRRDGWRSAVLAALLVPELIYDMFQHAVYFRSLFDLVRRREERWAAT